MGNAVNVFDIASESLAVFLAKGVSDGTWSDVIATVKADAAAASTAASAIETNAGVLWANMVDDYIQATYPLIKAAVAGPATSTNTAIATWNGVGGGTLQDSVVTIDASGNVVTAGSVTLGSALMAGVAAVPGGTPAVGSATLWVKSTTPPTLWVTDSDGTDWPLNTSAQDLASVLAAGSSTSTNNIEVTTGDSIVGTDGGSLSFAATTGLITLSDTCVGSPGTEGAGVTIGGAVFDAPLKASNVAGGSDPLFILHQHSSTGGPVIVAARSHSDTTAHAVVQNADSLFVLYAAGWDGVDYAFGGSLAFKVDGTPGAGDMPTKFEVAVSADGSESPTTRLAIAPDGTTTITGDLSVTGTGGIGTYTDVAATLDTVTRMPTISLSAATATPDGTATLSTSGSVTPVIVYPDAVSSRAFWLTTVPWTYSGGDLTIRVTYTGDVSSTLTFGCTIYVKVIADGVTTTTLGGTLAASGAQPGPATALTLTSFSAVATNAQLDSMAPGDRIAVRLSRSLTDDYTGSIYGVMLELIEAAP